MLSDIFHIYNGHPPPIHQANPVHHILTIDVIGLLFYGWDFGWYILLLQIQNNNKTKQFLYFQICREFGILTPFRSKCVTVSV